MRTNKLWLGLMAAAVLAVTGCANQKEPATKAVAAAEAALAAVSGDAAKFLPDDLKNVQGTLTSLKDALAKGDFKAVVAGAPALTASIGSLTTAVAGKKSEFDAANATAMTAWAGLSTDLPKMVGAIESRVGVLGGAKSLPKNVSREAFDAAKAGLDMMKATWGEASTAATSGNAVDAVAKAKMVQEKGAEVLKLLGMSQG
jgi:hypothetical protein